MTLTEPPQTEPTVEPGKRRSLWKIAIVGTLAVAVALVFAAVAFLLWTNSRIDRLDAEALPSLATAAGEKRTILVVGTDDRSSIPDDFDDVFGAFEGSRTDTIILVNLTPGVGAQMLSLPRDLKVDIPGEGTNRINAAFVFGGPELLISTINSNLALEVNHYVEIDLAGFARLVDAIGGVSFLFEHAARDAKSGLDVPAGVQRLTGEQALAYVRSRQYQELRNGTWETVGGNDIGRTRRQQQMLLTLFDEVASKRNAFNLPSFASTFADEVTVDAGMGLGVIVDLGRAALDLSTADIDTQTLPVVDFRGQDGRAYVVPADGADMYLASFRSGEAFPD
ncbi:MAG: LCP family protein [Acidimicrobiia bacterium]